MTDIVKTFAREILDWADAGCPKHYVFVTHFALCSNIRAWARWHGHNVELAAVELQDRLPINEDHVRPYYPFNSGLRDLYVRECQSLTNHCYTNKERIAWLREQVAENSSSTE